MGTPAQARRPWGVRIQHPDPRFRGALLEIPDPDKKVMDPVLGVKRPKVRPIRLDGEGCAIVSETVWRQLGRCMAHVDGDHVLLRFVVLNDVFDPPMQILGGPGQTLPVFRANPHDVRPVGPVELPGVRLKDR